MKPENLTSLRNVLANLYPDEASIRRVIFDSGIDLPRVTLNSTPINNWHSVLTEAEKIGQINTLLNSVELEYKNNRQFRKACDAYRRATKQNNDLAPIGVRPGYLFTLYKKYNSTFIMTIIFLITVIIWAISNNDNGNLYLSFSERLLEPKETWEQNGMALTPVKHEFSGNKLHIWWKIKNNTSQTIVVSYSHENFTAEDNKGRELTIGIFEGGSYACLNGESNILLKPGETLEFCKGNLSGFLPMSVSVNLSTPDLEYIVVTASNISRIEKAQWKFPANFR